MSNIDGSDKVQLTRYAKSVSNARWSLDGKFIYFIREGQVYKASYNAGKLGGRRKLTDIPAGVQEFSLSPDGNSIMYISGVHGSVERPVDTDPMLSKADAYAPVAKRVAVRVGL